MNLKVVFNTKYNYGELSNAYGMYITDLQLVERIESKLH